MTLLTEHLHGKYDPGKMRNRYLPEIPNNNIRVNAGIRNNSLFSGREWLNEAKSGEVSKFRGRSYLLAEIIPGRNLR